MRRELGTKLRQRTTIISMAVIAVLAVVLFLSLDNSSAPQVTPIPFAKTTAQEQQIALTSPRRMTVYMGDTITEMFQRNQLHHSDLNAILKTTLAKTYLPNISIGKTITYQLNSDGHIKSLSYPIDKIKTLTITRTGTQYKAEIAMQPLTTSLLYKSATVHHSLNAAALAAGLSATQFSELRSMFAGSINLDRHARRGDHFSVLSQEYYLKGQKYSQGDIIAADYHHLGKDYRAIRYTYPKNHTSYYTPDGHGVEPLFLRAPLHYKRISSIFTYRRLDPYLHVYRPHLGVDYAAPVGTPIKALGDGRIEFRGRDEGYGNAVIIRFSHKYKALYGHLEKFARNLHDGEYVHRGQVIGYVGDTGWSTGPHLHFSMYVNGIAKDPLKLKFPGGKSVPASYLNRYLAYSKNILAQLDLYQGPQFAKQ